MGDNYATKYMAFVNTLDTWITALINGGSNYFDQVDFGDKVPITGINVCIIAEASVRNVMFEMAHVTWEFSQPLVIYCTAEDAPTGIQACLTRANAIVNRIHVDRTIGSTVRECNVIAVDPMGRSDLGQQRYAMTLNADMRLLLGA